MDMRRKYAILLLLPVLLTACKFGREESVDFTQITGQDSTMFRVVAQHEVDLENGFPMNCYLPDGMRINEYEEQAEEANMGPRKTKLGDRCSHRAEPAGLGKRQESD